MTTLKPPTNNGFSQIFAKGDNFSVFSLYTLSIDPKVLYFLNSLKSHQPLFLNLQFQTVGNILEHTINYYDNYHIIVVKDSLLQHQSLVHVLVGCEIDIIQVLIQNHLLCQFSTNPKVIIYLFFTFWVFIHSSII
jgi:hypothetical protein